MKKKKFLIAFFLWSFLSFSYMQNFSFVESINNKLVDLFFAIRGEKTPSNNIVIVDIDENSLVKMNGFSKKKLSKIINNIKDSKASLIALDMTFPQSSKEDIILANSFKNAKAISGILFDFSSTIKRGSIPNLPFVVIQKGFIGHEFIPVAKGMISNNYNLQENSYSSGFLNMISDNDGVVRSAPLIIKYKNLFYPSLALEVAREYFKSKNITINYGEAGVDSIFLDKFEIPTDRFGRLIINYKATSKSYQYISANKIYKNTFKKELLKNKIVLIGASTSRFYDLRATPLDSTFWGVEIHANVIDNIINNEFLIRPNWIELLDISILFSLLYLILIFSTLKALKSTFLSIFVIGSFLILSFWIFNEYGIILNLIYPLGGGFLLYSILTTIEYIYESKQKEKLNKRLIEEMKSRQKVIEDEVTYKTNELKKIAEEKTVLLRELHHRVKNNLQLILSIISLQQHEIKDDILNTEFIKLQNRIKSIAKTHEILYDNDDISNVDMGEYIGELCEEIQSSIVSDNVKIVLDITACLPLREAVYVGLVINELISNSIKHAFDNNCGEIYVYLAKFDNEYILRVGDSGKGYEKSFAKDGTLGLKLVDTLILNQLDGSITTQSNEKFEYIIKFKL